MQFGDSTFEFPSEAVVYDLIRGFNDILMEVAVCRFVRIPILKHISTSAMTSSYTVDSTLYFPIFVHSMVIACVR